MFNSLFNYLIPVLTLLFFSQMQYNPGDSVHNYNLRSFTDKALKNLEDAVLTKNGVLTIFTTKGFKCPFDDKPKDGNKFALAQHAMEASMRGKTARVKGLHKAVLEYMKDKYEDVDPSRPGKNAAQHERRKKAKMARQDQKLYQEHYFEAESHEN